MQEEDVNPNEVSQDDASTSNETENPYTLGYKEACATVTRLMMLTAAELFLANDDSAETVKKIAKNIGPATLGELEARSGSGSSPK